MSCEYLPTVDLKIYQGDDKTFKFRYSVEGEPVDITDYVINLECQAPELSKQATILDQTTNKGEYQFSYVPEDTQGGNNYRVKYEVVFWPNGLDYEKNTKYKGSLVIVREHVT